MARNRFTRGTWNCEVCGRLTRDAGQAVDHLCTQCEEILGADNMVNDNDYRPGTPDFDDTKLRCDSLLQDIETLGGDAAQVRASAGFLYGDAFKARDMRRAAK